MINLTGKSVFVKTQEEYENILNIARLQGFNKWSDKVSLSSRNIKLPNILIFKDNGTVAYWSDKGVLEASEIIEDEEKIKDAVKLVRAFTKYPDRTALTDSFIKSLKLLADTVESQMEEVKQMERLTKWEDGSITYNEKRELECGEYCDSCSQGAGNCKTVENMIKKLATYEDLEEQGLLVRLPVPLGSKVYCISTRDKQNSIIFEKNFVLGMLYFWDSTVFATREEAEKKLRRSWRR